MPWLDGSQSHLSNLRSTLVSSGDISRPCEAFLCYCIRQSRSVRVFNSTPPPLSRWVKISKSKRFQVLVSNGVLADESAIRTLGNGNAVSAISYDLKTHIDTMFGLHRDGLTIDPETVLIPG